MLFAVRVSELFALACTCASQRELLLMFNETEWAIMIINVYNA